MADSIKSRAAQLGHDHSLDYRHGNSDMKSSIMHRDGNKLSSVMGIDKRLQQHTGTNPNHTDQVKSTYLKHLHRQDFPTKATDAVIDAPFKAADKIKNGAVNVIGRLLG